MNEITEAFGKAIRQKRKEQKLTQEQLGFEADIQRIYVSKLELGQQQPSLTTIFKLANGLNYSASSLIKDVEDILNEASK